MKKFVCPVCGYVYEGDALPEGFVCPQCKVPGSKFIVKEENEMSELFKKFGVDAVVYGHLHGQRKMELKFEKDDISYFLTSCDMVANSLVQIFPSI